MSKLFWAMLSFITRLPVPRRWSQGLDFEHYSRGIITFPLIDYCLARLAGWSSWCCRHGVAYHWRHCLAYLCWR